ncbi:MAG TPA: alpha/beta fold hydrolase [Isosphaeraceae bacterium]|nr:alpha/beta fold hydrolase [Isosphaeraceae bacterium]
MVPIRLPRISRRRLRRGFVVFVAVLASWLLVSSAVAYRLTRRYQTRIEEPAPSPAWGQLERHRLVTRDGQELGAWFVDGRDDAPSVLVLHGHKGRRWNSLSRAELLASHGCAVLMISHRAHGDSTGEFDDLGFGARHDVVAAVQFLEARRPGRPVVVDGSSMGAAAAVFATAELGHRVRGYILESPYQDLEVAVWNRVELALPPLLCHIAYAGLKTVAPIFLPHLAEISPLLALAGIPDDVPVLILAGADDRLARPEEARALHDRVATHGRLVFIPGAGHGDLLHSAPELYARTVVAFCREIATPARIRSTKISPSQDRGMRGMAR